MTYTKRLRPLALTLRAFLLSTLLLAGCAHQPKLAGNLSMTFKDYEQAVVEYQKALKEEPDSARLLTGLGRAYYNLGQYDKAEEAFRHAAGVESYPSADFYVGLCQIARGDRTGGFETLTAFRYPGRIHVTKSVRDMAARLAANPDLTDEAIARAMFRAWDEGVDRERDSGSR
ncbi:tetratricopeptide repeat protein [Pseudodesulfovibrio sp. F-1]|uniref:Tetratricopeptide repeat protein n=1 Tax=Pseudodesulfovibrio alkaliphilus TaxID=2661613 RepID=A0A7K1KK35_9BACT|nr:tetratricopeptide repeat protein [Pseudodesulfovibrio alkaliphilus]MUM76242.1 tetratricopeptide repeat protein [Pseudodesulfovibrio alkaliphilus]